MPSTYPATPLTRAIDGANEIVEKANRLFQTGQSMIDVTTRAELQSWIATMATFPTVGSDGSSDSAPVNGHLIDLTKTPGLKVQASHDQYQAIFSVMLAFAELAQNSDTIAASGPFLMSGN